MYLRPKSDIAYFVSWCIGSMALKGFMGLESRIRRGILYWYWKSLSNSAIIPITCVFPIRKFITRVQTPQNASIPTRRVALFKRNPSRAKFA